MYPCVWLRLWTALLPQINCSTVWVPKLQVNWPLWELPAEVGACITCTYNEKGQNLRNHSTWTKEITVDYILKQPSFVCIPHSFIYLIECHLERTWFNRTYGTIFLESMLKLVVMIKVYLLLQENPNFPLFPLLSWCLLPTDRRWSCPQKQ